jgi:periplasmic protein TonB
MKKFMFIGLLALASIPFFAQSPDPGKKVETEATFPGGPKKMSEYISKTIRYPESAIANNLQGKVYVGFVVRADGTLADVMVVRGASEVLDKEAVRVVQNMPKWKPARNGAGKKVPSNQVLPIHFTLN